MIGTHAGRAIYLLYNGIPKDQSPGGGNVLTGPVFDALPEFAGPKVIYAAANRLASRTAREGITFKKSTYAPQCLSHDDLCPQNLPIVGTRKPGDLFQGVP